MAPAIDRVAWPRSRKYEWIDLFRARAAGSRIGCRDKSRDGGVGRDTGMRASVSHLDGTSSACADTGGIPEWFIHGAREKR